VKSLALKCLNLLAAAGIVAGALAVFAAPPPAGLFALDVGQGDSILVRAPNGADALVDAGPPGGASGRAFAAAAPRDRDVGAVLLTHQDLDHSGSAADFLKRFETGALFAPVWSEKAADVLLVAAGRGVATGTLQRGDRVWLDRETPVYLDVLWPPAGPAATDGNDGSMVTRLVYGSSSAILTGDAPKGVERLLVAANDPLDADFLKVGHHGSKTSSDPDFLAAVSPTLAIVSAGKGNRYGHPAPEVLAALRAAGAPAVATADAGTVSLLWNRRGLAPTV
jgi:competence protein ComEC